MEKTGSFYKSRLSWPQDIVFLEDKGEVLISDLNTGNIARFDANSGSYKSDFAKGIGEPTHMKIGKDILLYVLQWNGDGRGGC